MAAISRQSIELPQPMALTRTETCVERRCKIKWALLAGRVCTLQSLADEYDVTTETIRRDMISLGRFIPVQTKKVVEVQYYVSKEDRGHGPT